MGQRQALRSCVATQSIDWPARNSEFRAGASTTGRSSLLLPEVIPRLVQALRSLCLLIILSRVARQRRRAYPWLRAVHALTSLVWHVVATSILDTAVQAAAVVTQIAPIGSQVLAVGAHVPLNRANIRPISRDIPAVRLDVFVVRLDILTVRPNIGLVARDVGTSAAPTLRRDDSDSQANTNLALPSRASTVKS